MIRIDVLSVAMCCGIFAATTGCFAQDELPSADDVISKYIKTIGGRERLESVTSMELHGTRVKSQAQLADHPETNTADHPASKFSILVSKGRFASGISKESDGGAPTGFDGTRYWYTKPNQKPEWFELGSFFGNCSVGSSELDPIAVSLYWLTFPGVIEVEGITEIEGRQNYRLKLTPSHPEPWDKSRVSPTALQFEVESGLLKQIDFEYQTISYDDYRDVNGIRVPFRRTVDYLIRDVSGKYTWTWNKQEVIDSIELNIELNDRLFISPVKDTDDDDK